jgi:hypothetical protein
VKQGQKASDGSICRYRDDNGLMCAVGCRIPEHIYKLEMEGRDVYNLNEQFGRILPKEIAEYERMFGALQSVHDMDKTWESKANLKSGLTRVANTFKLSIPECVQSLPDVE